MLLIRHIHGAVLLGFSLTTHPQASAAEVCSTRDAVARHVRTSAIERGFAAPVFKIQRQADGQALLYWDYGERSNSFYAVTFRADGCAVLTEQGSPRRFVFPKNRYNTGVFYEMDLFRLAT